MKKILKFGCLSIIALIVFSFVLSSIFSDEIEEVSGKQKQEKLEVKKWSEQNITEKKETIKQFTQSKEEPFYTQRFRLREVIISSIKNAAKYPETIELKEFYDNNSWVSISESYKADLFNRFSFSELNNDIFYVYTDFRSENRLGQKVRSTMIFKIFYNIDKIEIKNIQLEK